MTHEQATKIVVEWMEWKWDVAHRCFAVSTDNGGYLVDEPTREIERKLALSGQWNAYAQALAEIVFANFFTAIIDGEKCIYALMTASDEQRILAAAQTIEARGGAK